MANNITGIARGSIAEELGVVAGDTLLKINGEKINDVFDYKFVTQTDSLELLIKKQNGEEWLLEVEKDEFEDLGLEFDSWLMDEASGCRNKCIFCFIDQLPRNMRDTLYFKDDDARLSFLTGNYITLTNMSEAELDRIIKYRFSPINISVHATDTDVRTFMLKNKNAGKLMAYIEKFFEADIAMNYQIVLCKGVNDGAELERTVEELSRFMPAARSVSIVPVGLTKHRDGLPELEPLGKEDSRRIIQYVERCQVRFLQEQDTRFVFAADELYLTAEVDLPPYEHYEDFPQLENGVGMLALFADEVDAELKSEPTQPHRNEPPREASIITGVASYDFMKNICARLESIFNVKIHVHPIKNNFFGESVTVTGLLTGGDIIAQLQDSPLGEALIIPKNCLRADDTVFLDDCEVSFLEKCLKTRVNVVKCCGTDFVQFFRNLCMGGETPNI